MPALTETVDLFGLVIDRITKRDAVARAMEWIGGGAGDCRFIVSPNVDHVVELRRNSMFKRAYRAASMVLADGMPILWVSRLLRRALPERVAGPDFVVALLDAAARRGGVTVCVLGGAPGVAQRAARNIHGRWPGLDRATGISPPQDFSSAHRENAQVLRETGDCAADILIVGLGAPKQEIWVSENLKSLRSSVVVCAGGTIDLLAGRYSRAPYWLQALGGEWVYRLMQEPARLWRRYARDLARFPALVLIELLRIADASIRKTAFTPSDYRTPSTVVPIADSPAPRIYDYRDIRAVELELTTECNADCPMCPRNAYGGSRVESLPAAELSLSDVKAIFGERFLRQLDRLYLCGTYGDPQMAVDALGIIEWFRRAAPALSIGMATNGGARDRQWWRELARVMGPTNWVTFAIDGLENTNGLYRQHVSWKRLMSHAQEFIRAGGQARWEYIVFRHNENEINEARALAARMGFQKFTCKRTYRFQHKDHSVMVPFPVKDRNGHVVRFLEPPLNPTHVNPRFEEARALIDHGNWPSFLNATPIDCLVKQQRLLHITAEGLVFPCGWLYDRMYGEYAHSESCLQVQKLLERCGGKASIDARLRAIEDIVHGELFHAIAASWNKESTAQGRLARCATQCGSLAPARAQRAEALDNVFPVVEKNNRQL
jgi:N-acetylglucosaminyldiphosphoundecaprenol N-acetyl-beta-D-mannosaminyltransferase